MKRQNRRIRHFYLRINQQYSGEKQQTCGGSKAERLLALQLPSVDIKLNPTFQLYHVYARYPQVIFQLYVRRCPRVQNFFIWYVCLTLVFRARCMPAERFYDHRRPSRNCRRYMTWMFLLTRTLHGSADERSRPLPAHLSWPSFEFTTSHTSEDVPVSTSEADLDDKGELWSLKTATAASNKPNFKHYNCRTESSSTDYESVFAKDLKSAVKDLLETSFRSWSKSSQMTYYAIRSPMHKPEFVQLWIPSLRRCWVCNVEMSSEKHWTLI